MVRLDRIRSAWERRRRARVLRKIQKLRRLVDPLGPNRQFLYLDAVALRSLYVSRFGPEDARTTLTNARSRESEISASAGFGLTDIADLRGGGGFRSTTSSTIQVERVASEQSLFRDFLEREIIADEDSELWNGVPAKLTSSKAPGAIQRGDLIQVRVRLRADPVFGVASFVSAMSDMAAKSREGLASLGSLADIGPLLRHLLIDQVPIDSELIDWGWDERSQTIVSREHATAPLRLAALTELGNYWLDVRRVLFDDAECTALIRVARPVPASQWSAVKLFDAVRNHPGFASIDDAIRKFTGVVEAGIPMRGDSAHAFAEVLSTYASAREGEGLINSDEILAIAKRFSPRMPSAQAVSDSFDHVGGMLNARSGKVLAADDDALLRATTLKDGQFTADGEPLFPPTPAATAHSEDSHFVVGEVIALYW